LGGRIIVGSMTKNGAYDKFDVVKPPRLSRQNKDR
jgi:hypothetical protein